MLIIYNKRLGDIENVFTGDLQSIDSLYQEKAPDFHLIWEEFYIEEDTNILLNFNRYKIDLNRLPEKVIIFK